MRRFDPVAGTQGKTRSDEEEASPMNEETYDVTGVTDDREYIPIAASVTDRERAKGIAAERSADRSMIPWSAVLVKNASSGQILDTYVNGKRQP